MPVPSNNPALTLGRPILDKKQFRPDTDPAVIAHIERLALALQGGGWASAAKTGDEVYMAVYAQSDGGGAHNLYGGNPADPVNPYPLTVSASGSATVNWEEEGVLVLSSGTANFVGSGVTVTDVAGTATVTITGGGGGGSVTEAFTTIAVSGQSNVVADSATDTLTLVASTGIVITTNAGSDSITFAIDTATVAQNSFTTIAVSGQSNVVADSPTDTLTLVAGSNVTITTNAGSDSITIAAATDGVGYDEIQEEGTPLTKRAKLNFIGAASVVDNSGSGRTDVTLGGGGRFYLTSEEIPAGEWDGVTLTLGSGQAELFVSTGTGTYETDGESHTIYNHPESPVPSGSVVQCKLVDGLWVIDVEDCS